MPLISNEFNIDCWTPSEGVASGSIKNPMRVLSVSYENYTAAAFGAKESEEESIGKPTISITGSCPKSVIGSVTINGKQLSIYMDGNGKKHLLGSGSGLIIRPKTKFIREFWNSLDDFERVLLNRDSNPVYRAVFETPYSNENGW